MQNRAHSGIHVKRIILLLVAVIIMAVLIFWNYSIWTESYGLGPPYYGRTTNMDKWVSPIPMLAITNVVGLVISWVLVTRALKMR